MAANVTVGMSSTAAATMFWTIRNVICLVMELQGSTVVAQTDLICMSVEALAQARHHALNLQLYRPRLHQVMQQLRPRPKAAQLRPRVPAQLPRCLPQQAAHLVARRQHLRLPQVPQVPQVWLRHLAVPIMLQHPQPSP